MAEPAATEPVRPLPGRTVLLVALLLGLLTGGALVALIWWVNVSGALAGPRLDAVRVGVSIAVGGGGVFALFLAWRRQRSTEADHLQRERTLERTLEQQREVAADNHRDAVERRITELYTKSAELLGADTAPVRLAGIYALERLGQSNPGQRQTVVHVFCAYLRNPGEPDEQERHVRSTVQRVLSSHLRGAAAWPGLDVDLTGAVLHDFDFSGCVVRQASFDRATFRGRANFGSARFESMALFQGTQFEDHAEFGGAVVACASFDGARFAKLAVFNGAELGPVEFTGTAFEAGALFRGAGFKGRAVFGGARFGEATVFDDAKFHDLASLAGIVFLDSAVFTDVEFLGPSTFRRTDFRGDALFGGCVFRQGTDFAGALFGRWVNFRDVRFDGRADVFPAHARLDVDETTAKRAWPPTWQLVTSTDTELPGHEGRWGEVFDTTTFAEDA
ncbi:pentapeptide repeat-containing protein [Amycolatopsis sp. FBCC-B4732]|uniref:pentapeptide repeat-containing protein n=1 Tax=Amycolatopsis sp. FBCC-B4732 TaxID=3079339 RepID=UPI001FF51BD7|nr:pentapeptide repeat-containing protein [Amycolatopsis sp. FBCC-B4732]UOX87594.1 pentapeptide repeat-containing protein [Amycolatopsis sp. FBCC-B4732]